MIRVLHVIDHLGLGGAQSAVLDFLKNLDPAEVRADVAVIHGRGVFADALEAAGFPVHSLSAAKWPPAYVPGLLRLLRRERYDILHFHLPGANWLLKPLAALTTDAPRIAHDHTSGDIRFRGVRSLLPDTLAHFFSTRIVAVSEGVGRFLREWESIPADKLTVIPNGVDTGTFRPGTTDERRAAREALGLPAEALVVGAMGRLACEKNFSMLPELASHFPNVEFIIGGSGPEQDKIVALVEKYGVTGRFHLPGAVSDRVRFFHAIDIFVLPSLYEGLPMTLLEAMATGVPLLASRLDDIAATVDEEKEGLLAEAGAETEFRSQLARLSAQPAFRKELAENSLKKVRDLYSARETARRITELYRHELAIAPDGATGRH